MVGNFAYWTGVSPPRACVCRRRHPAAAGQRNPAGCNDNQRPGWDRSGRL